MSSLNFKENEDSNESTMIKIKLGMTVLLSIILPIGYLSNMLIGRMSSSFLQDYPPLVFISVYLVIKLVVAFTLVSLFISESNLINRLPIQIPGENLLFFGGFIVLVLQVLTPMRESSSTPFLMQLATPLDLVARLAMYLGAIKLLMSVKPHDSYIY